MKFDFSKESERKRFYNLYAWRGINGARNKARERDKECVWCKEKGLVTVTKLEVDHIIPLEHCTFEEALSLDNLRVLCNACHNRRHNRYQHPAFKKNKYHEDERW